MRNRRPASPPSCVCCLAGGALGVLPGALRSPTALCARSPGLRRCLHPCPPARLRCFDVVLELVGCTAVCPQRVTAPGLCNSQVKSSLTTFCSSIFATVACRCRPRAALPAPQGPSWGNTLGLGAPERVAADIAWLPRRRAGVPGADPAIRRLRTPRRLLERGRAPAWAGRAARPFAGWLAARGPAPAPGPCISQLAAATGFFHAD
jgi:hypothetical protein